MTIRVKIAVRFGLQDVGSCGSVRGSLRFGSCGSVPRASCCRESSGQGGGRHGRRSDVMLRFIPDSLHPCHIVQHAEQLAKPVQQYAGAVCQERCLPVPYSLQVFVESVGRAQQPWEDDPLT